MNKFLISYIAHHGNGYTNGNITYETEKNRLSEYDIDEAREFITEYNSDKVLCGIIINMIYLLGE